MKLLKDRIRTEVGRDVISKVWDTAVHKCKASIKRIKKRIMRRQVQCYGWAHLPLRHSLMQNIQKSSEPHTPSDKEYEWSVLWNVSDGSSNEYQSGNEINIYRSFNRSMDSPSYRDTWPLTILLPNSTRSSAGLTTPSQRQRSIKRFAILLRNRQIA